MCNKFPISDMMFLNKVLFQMRNIFLAYPGDPLILVVILNEH